MSESHNPTNLSGDQETVLYAREQLEPKHLGFEQIKFIFVKLQEWLLTRKQATLEQLHEMLTRLKHLYPHAHRQLLKMINQQIQGYILAPQPVHVTPPPPSP